MFQQAVLDRYPSSTLLFQAALSHLELAVVNVSSQAAVLQEEEAGAIEVAIACLKNVLDHAKPRGSDHASVGPCRVRKDLEAVGPGFGSSVDHLLRFAPLGPVSEAMQVVSEPYPCESCEDFEAVCPVLSAKRFLEDPVACVAVPMETQTESASQLASQPDSETDEASHQQEVNLQPWLSRLMDVFDQIDTDKSGTIDLEEWKSAVSMGGIDSNAAEEMFRLVDSDHTNEIDRVAWLHMLHTVQLGECPQLIHDFSEALGKLQAKNGRIYKAPHFHRHHLIIRPDSTFRIAWDLCMTLLLGYIAIQLPYAIGFPDDTPSAFKHLNNAIDYVFMVDLILNFRTAYTAETLIFDPWHIAKHYMSGWFTLDLLTCLPLDKITAGALPNLQSARLLKLGKIMKVFRLLKIAKLTVLCNDSEFWERVEDTLLSSTYEMFFKLFCMLLNLIIVSHWMACLMSFSGSSWRGLDVPDTLTYNEAIYWSMTTLTTVGYGDVSPSALSERLCAVFAMVVGGMFYAYVLGNITATITSRDLNIAAYKERLGQVRAWLQYHNELPLNLRRRTKKYFQVHLAQKTAIDDSAILNDLSPALLHDVCYFMAPEVVRSNLLFNGMPLSCLSQIVPILENTVAEIDERIVSKGDTGVAMYIIQKGEARFQEGHQYQAFGLYEITPDPLLRTTNTKSLSAGGSFGEEIVLDLEEEHHYSVVAKTSIVLFVLSKKDFQDTFKTNRHLLRKMCLNFTHHCEDVDVAPEGSKGRATVLHAADKFNDMVLDQLAEIKGFFSSSSPSEERPIDPSPPVQSSIPAAPFSAVAVRREMSNPPLPVERKASDAIPEKTANCFNVLHDTSSASSHQVCL